MTVQILDEQAKDKIVYYKNTGLYPNTSLAEMFKVSEKTIRRVLKEKAESSPTTKGFDFVEEMYEEEGTQETYSFIATNKAITLMRDSDARTVDIQRDDERFDEFFLLISEYGDDNDILEEIFEGACVATMLQKYEKDGLCVDTEIGRVSYIDEDGEVVFHGRLVEKLIKSLQKKGENGKKFKRLANFAKRLAKNPSNKAVERLFEFLEMTGIEITNEGMVKCYKKVDGNFKDIYTGTIDNSVGKEVRVPRNQVDEDMEKTCSHGLHVCSAEYLPHYGTAPGNIVLEVEVNPADFVAIPRDYNNAKARVCGYFVNRIADDVVNI